MLYMNTLGTGVQPSEKLDFVMERGHHSSVITHVLVGICISSMFLTIDTPYIYIYIYIKALQDGGGIHWTV